MTLHESSRVAAGIVSLCARIVPAHVRSAWQREWRAEIGTTSRRHVNAESVGANRLIVRSLGAFPDALALRWHEGVRPSLTTDLGYAVRSNLRRPFSSALVIVVLALGIGTATAAWSVVRDVLIAPLPYPEPDRLVVLWDEQTELGVRRSGPSPANVLDWRERTNSFDGVAAWYAGEPRSLSVDGTARKIGVAQVTADFFDVMGVAPELGRVLRAEEIDSDARVVVLSAWLWREMFGSDPDLVDRSLSIDGVDYRVAGVLPDSFAIPDGGVGIWVPWSFEHGFANLGYIPRDYRFLNVIARLRPGVTLATAQVELDGVNRELEAQYPVNSGWSTRITTLKEEIVGDLRPALLALLAAVGFVLAIAGTNATHLLVARFLNRRTELAVRSALGAARARVGQLLFLECLVLCLAAAALGALAGGLALSALVRLAPTGIARLSDAALGSGGVALAAALGIVMALALVAGCSAVVWRSDPGDSLRSRVNTGDARSRRLQRGLIVAQTAASLSLVVMAMLTVQSLARVVRVDPGFDADGVLVARVFPDPQRYRSVPERLAYFDDLTTRLAALPGVERVGAASGLPMNEYNNVPSVAFSLPDRPVVEGGPEVAVTMATTGYHTAMGMRLLEGRLFDERDTLDAAQVVLVNDVVATTLWPGTSAVGEVLRMSFGRGREADYEVVGVVNGTHATSLKSAPPPQAYRPHAQAPYVTMNVVLRTSLDDPTTLSESVRAAIAAIDPSQPVHSITTLRRLVDETVAIDRLTMWLLGGLAMVALLLAGAGIYGVMAHGVRARGQEFGVRLALGAGRSDLIRMVVRTGVRLLVPGVAVGLAIALVAGRLLQGMLYQAVPSDPLILLAASAMVGIALLAACWIPARRAAGVDPASALSSGN